MRVRRPTDYNPSIAAALGPSHPSPNLNLSAVGLVAGYVGDGKTGNALTKKAFAAFCVAEVEKREWVRKAPFICTPCL